MRSPIANPLIVYSIAPIQAFDIPPDYDYPQAICNFTLEDGSTLYDTTSSAQDTDPPQRVIAVACLPSQYSGTNSSIIPSGLYPTGTPYTITYPTAVGTVSSIAPPYPTGTGSYYVPGTTGASASAAPSATGVMPLGRRGVVLLGERSFTGDAGRFTRSLGVSIVALLGVAAGLWIFPWHDGFIYRLDSPR